MDIDDKDLSEASNDSSSGPEEIKNKDAKDVAVTSIKAEFASQRLLKDKAKKLRLQIELRNIEQKKIKAKKKAENDSSSPKTVKSDIDDEANVSLEVEKTKSVKPKKSKKVKKIIKSPINLENSNDKPDSSTGNGQAEQKKEPQEGSSNDKEEPKKLTGNARKKARKRFTKASVSGKVFKNKLVKNSAIKTEKNAQRFKKMKMKTKNQKTDLVKDNNSTEKAHGKKRKLKEINKNMPKIKSMKKVAVKTEKTN